MGPWLLLCPVWLHVESSLLLWVHAPKPEAPRVSWQTCWLHYFWSWGLPTCPLGMASSSVACSTGTVGSEKSAGGVLLGVT